MALDPTALGGNIQTLISQLLNGTSAPTGIGSSRPAALGPNPVRQPLVGAGGVLGQGNLNSQNLWALLAPYIALLGGQGGGTGNLATASGSDAVTQFLTQVINSLVGIPGAPSGGTPSTGVPPMTAPLASQPTTASILSSAAGGPEGGGGPGGGGTGGGNLDRNIGSPDLAGRGV